MSKALHPKTLGSWIRSGRSGTWPAAAAAPPFASRLHGIAIPIPERRLGRPLRLASPGRRPWAVAAMMRTVVETRKDAAGAPSVESEESAAHENDPRNPDAALKQQKTGRGPRMEGDRRKYLGFQERNSGERDLRLDIGKLKEELASNSAAAPVFRVKIGNRMARSQSSDGSGEDRVPLLRQQGPNVRRAVTESADSLSSKRQHSFREDVGHAAAESIMLTGLTWRLLRYLGVGYRWVTKLLALGLYAIFLMPGFIQVGYHYLFSEHVHRSIVYGKQPRNRLDLYRSDFSGTPKPVVIFITGGAWIIGYKAWGALLGIQMLERDIMVCCIDYRNFPQGGVSDMVEDVSTGIGFVVNNIDQYGGDPDRIYLAGQSAGSHLAACALIDQARIEIGQKEGTMTWNVGQLKAFLGISGGYNLPKLVDHFHGRGLYRRIFLSVMEGEHSLPSYSPEMAVRSESFVSAIPLLPPIYLFHGTADYSIPSEASTNFGNALSEAGARATVKLYPDKTHTDVFLQDPMRGGYDALFDDVVGVVHADDAEAKAKDAAAPMRRRMVPEFLLKLARAVSPF